MEYAICIVPAAPLRKEPSHRSEMTNQLLFGETMQVLEIKDEWCRIKTVADSYEGWLTYHLIAEIDREIALAKQQYVASDLLNSLVLGNQLMNIPMGSVLLNFNEADQQLWNAKIKYAGAFRNVSRPPSTDMIIQSARQLINAPYLWGGKTILGIDCSGFVQTVFKVNGFQLLRDAYQQADEGTEVEELAAVKEADLAFFHNDHGRVTHVGILLSPGQIIHSSGRVRIDTIDNKGIINSENGKRTHNLHSIRRIAG